MDFRFSEEQQALQGLARQILEREILPERLKQVEAGEDWFDRAAWAHLAEANLLGLAVPEAQGGMEMGFLELCLLLHEVGRAVAPVPALPALAWAGLPLAAFGSEEQRQRWLAPLARGESILTAAPGDEPVSARRDGDAWRLAGTRANVPALHLAERVLVPAGDGAAFLVDPGAAGVRAERSVTSRGEPVFQLALDGASVPDSEALTAPGLRAWLEARALVACAATQVGVSERALEITTSYLKEREQFGAPLGALPPVQHRCADAYIALDALRWVTWQAAWKLAAGREALADARIAKFWAADAGSKIATATQHLHGGMGVDLDYPIHRFFLWSKVQELTLGAATPQLAKLGQAMAAGPAPAELA